MRIVLPPCPLCGAAVEPQLRNKAVAHVSSGRCNLSGVCVSESDWTRLVSLLRDGLAVEWLNQDPRAERAWMVKPAAKFGDKSNRDPEWQVGVVRWWVLKDGYKASTLHEAVEKARKDGTECPKKRT